MGDDETTRPVTRQARSGGTDTLELAASLPKGEKPPSGGERD